MRKIFVLNVIVLLIKKKCICKGGYIEKNLRKRTCIINLRIIYKNNFCETCGINECKC